MLKEVRKKKIMQEKSRALVDEFMKVRREAKTLSRIRKKRFEPNLFQDF
jgi:hypothetical protein